MAGLVATRADMTTVRRVITRPSAAGGEDFDGVDDESFAQQAKAGAFALWWRAHGLSYGIPWSELAPLKTGSDVLVNLSRSVLAEADALFPDTFHVFNITAPAAVLAERLAARGREAPVDIARRVARASAPLPDGLRVASIDNGGSLETAIAQASAILDTDWATTRSSQNV